MQWAVVSPVSFWQEQHSTRATFRKSKRAWGNGAWSGVNI